MLDKLIDKYFLGSGTRSIRPENEVAKLISNGAYILDVRTALEAKKGIAPGATIIGVMVNGDDMGPRFRVPVEPRYDI